MTAGKDSALRGLWAVAWRSVAYLPLMLVTFIIFLAHCVALVALPMFAVVLATSGFWAFAAGVGLIWVAAIWCWRRFRVGEHFRTPWNSP